MALRLRSQYRTEIGDGTSIDNVWVTQIETAPSYLGAVASTWLRPLRERLDHALPTKDTIEFLKTPEVSDEL